MSEESGQEISTDTTVENQETEAIESGDTLLTGSEATEDDSATTDTGEEAGSDAPEVPESYEFNMPEGMELDQALADAATPVFKELGLTQEQANKLTDLWSGQAQAQAQEQSEAFAAQLEKWATELKNDKEVGGEAFDANTATAREAINKLGSDELRELMDSTGIGNNPAMFKFCLAVGKLLVEDQPGSGTLASAPKDREQVMYPNM